jgi:hypothetical protein
MSLYLVARRGRCTTANGRDGVEGATAGLRGCDGGEPDGEGRGEGRDGGEPGGRDVRPWRGEGEGKGRGQGAPVRPGGARRRLTGRRGRGGGDGAV